MTTKRRKALKKFEEAIEQLADELLGELEDENNEDACQFMEAAEGMLRDAAEELEQAREVGKT
jgi:hypothetical protein